VKILEADLRMQGNAVFCDDGKERGHGIPPQVTICADWPSDTKRSLAYTCSTNSKMVCQYSPLFGILSRDEKSVWLY
jgi:hypothetical protein